MSHAPLSTAPRAESPGRPEEPAATRSLAEPTTLVTRVLGALFLGGFLSYGSGFALVGSVTTAPHFLSSLPTHRTALALGALLMAVNTGVDVAKAVLLFPLLQRTSTRAALAYLAAMIVEVVLLTVGVLALLALVPLSRHAGGGRSPVPDWAETVGAVLLQGNVMAYQLGETALACGAVILCGVLYRARLLPRAIAVWGLVGYLVLMTGAVAEVLGVHIGLALSIPGGLWEITFGIWLLVRGFRPSVTALTGRP